MTHSGTGTPPNGRGPLLRPAATATPAALPTFPVRAASARPAGASAPDARHQRWWRAPAGEGSPERQAPQVPRRAGRPAEVRVRGLGGTMATVAHTGTPTTVRLRPHGSVTPKDSAR